MSITTTASNTTAPTQFVRAGSETYAYRRFGSGTGRPLVCLQHFAGTLDNCDPAVTDTLASGHGSLFQFHESFARQAAAFLASDSPSAAD